MHFFLFVDTIIKFPENVLNSLQEKELLGTW